MPHPGLPDRPPRDQRPDRESLRRRQLGPRPDLLRQDPAPDPPHRHRDGRHSPLTTGLTRSPPHLYVMVGLPAACQEDRQISSCANSQFLRTPAWQPNQFSIILNVPGRGVGGGMSEYTSVTRVTFIQVIGNKSFVISCRYCDGNGRQPGQMLGDGKVVNWRDRACEVCSGKGMLRVESDDIPTNCGPCFGHGRRRGSNFGAEKCRTCSGVGVLSVTGDIKVLR